MTSPYLTMWSRELMYKIKLYRKMRNVFSPSSKYDTMKTHLGRSPIKHSKDQCALCPIPSPGGWWIIKHKLVDLKHVFSRPSHLRTHRILGHASIGQIIPRKSWNNRNTEYDTLHSQYHVCWLPAWRHRELSTGSHLMSWFLYWFDV